MRARQHVYYGLENLLLLLMLYLWLNIMLMQVRDTIIILFTINFTTIKIISSRYICFFSFRFLYTNATSINMARLPTNNTTTTKIPVTYEIIIGSVLISVTVLSDVNVVKEKLVVAGIVDMVVVLV